jgi:hypothetical protein
MGRMRQADTIVDRAIGGMTVEVGRCMVMNGRAARDAGAPIEQGEERKAKDTCSAQGDGCTLRWPGPVLLLPRDDLPAG